MKRFPALLPAAFLAATLALALPAAAQDLKLPAPSPLAQVMQTVGTTSITVTYSSPGKKGRDIFGGLVPFDKLWRTGANAATTIEFTTDVKVGGKPVPAGKYAIFSIPKKDTWTVILNKNPNQGGTNSYDAKLDQARIDVKPESSPARERMTFLFRDTQDGGTTLDLDWAGTRVSLPITVDTDALSKKGIADYQSGSSRGLANAARYMADTAKDLDAALKLIDASLVVEQTWFNTWLKADFLARKGDYKAAYPLAEQAYAMGQKADYFFWKDQVEKALKDWKGKT
ncbi:MAG: DUF2911 domain-containing protein, partial [Myxococcales bacterium]|nr:DUF2911 domain-containing protein [Myxococcales bacterium]